MRGVVYTEVPGGWQLEAGRCWGWKGVGCLGEMYFEAMTIKKNQDRGSHLNQKRMRNNKS